jgi:hypothetical protein
VLDRTRTRWGWLAAPMLVGAATIAAAVFGFFQVLLPYLYPPAGTPSPTPIVNVPAPPAPVVNVAPPIVNVPTPTVNIPSQPISVPRSRVFIARVDDHEGTVALAKFLSKNDFQVVFLELTADSTDDPEPFGNPEGDDQIQVSIYAYNKPGDIRFGGVEINLLRPVGIQHSFVYRTVRGFFRVEPVVGMKQGFTFVALRPISDGNYVLADPDSLKIETPSKRKRAKEKKS